jgi:hypothetical protein
LVVYLSPSDNFLLENFPRQKTRIRPQKPEFTRGHTSR